MAKWGARLLGACVLALAAWFAINATDEPLSDEARAAMVVPPLPAPDRDNGFLDFLVLSAPAEAPTFEAALERLAAYRNQTGGEVPPAPWGPYKRDARLGGCAIGGAAGNAGGASACFDVAREPWVAAAIEAHAAFLERYRVMRKKPRFVNLIELKSQEDALPAYFEPLDAQRLVLLGAARAFHAGDRTGALRELEEDAAFYRRMARDSASLIDKMISFAALDRLALFAVELARRTPRGDAAAWRRLEALTAPLTRDELDVVPSLRRAYAETLRWMQARSYVRLSDAMYEQFQYVDRSKVRPWWDAVAPHFYRPRQTANWMAAGCETFLALAELPSTEFFPALARAKERVRALAPGAVASLVLNPAGWRHPAISGCEEADYIARMHGRAGVQSLAQLVVRLRAAGVSTPQELDAALSGPLGREHPDPFTGKPMRFDAKDGTIGFAAEPMHISGAARPHVERYGRMALPL